MSDLFGPGNRMLDVSWPCGLARPYVTWNSFSATGDGYPQVFEIEVFGSLARAAGRDPGTVVLNILVTGPDPGHGLGRRSMAADSSQAGASRHAGRIDPTRRESDTRVRRGRAAMESMHLLPASAGIGAFRTQVAAGRGTGIAVVASPASAGAGDYYALRRPRPLSPARSPGQALEPFPTPSQNR